MDKRQRLALAAVMRRHRGFATTEQSRDAGIDDQALSRAVRNGELRRHRRRVYTAPGRVTSVLDDLAADLAACERQAVAARSAALEIMRLRPPWLRLRREILVHGSCKPLIRGGVVAHRTRSLEAIDVWLVEDFPCTTPARTVIDLTPGLTHVQRLKLLDEVASAPLCDRRMLHTRAAALRNGRAGVGLIADLTGPKGEARFRSGLERAGLPLLLAAGLVDPQVNVVPRDAPSAGLTDVVSEVDRIIVDWDGLRFHAGPRARQRDNDKANAAALGGYLQLRFTWQDVYSRGGYVTATTARARARPRRR